MNIFQREILDYYDCVFLFEAEDETGRKYIAVHNDDYQTGCEYIVTPVIRTNLTEFKAGRMDLRHLMAASPNGQWYTTRMGVETTGVVLEPGDGPVADSGNLPAEGRYITAPINMDRNAQRFAVESGRPAMTVRVGGTEELDAHEIRASVFTSMVRRFTEGMKSLVQEIPHVAPESQHEMKLIGSPRQGSVEILLASPMRGGWFEQDHIVSGMDEWTKMLNASFNENNVETVIQSHGGQSLRQLRLFAEWLQSNKVYLDIEWSAGIRGSSGAVLVDSKIAGVVANKLKIDRKTTTTVELAGILDSISLSKRTWAILTSDGRITGKARYRSVLDGCTAGRYYILLCERTVDEMSNDTRPKFEALEIVESMVVPARLPE